MYFNHVVKDLETIIRLFSSEHETKIEFNLPNKNSKFNISLTNPLTNNLLLIEKFINDELENLKVKTFQIESFENLSNILFSTDNQIKPSIDQIQELTFTHIGFKRIKNQLPSSQDVEELNNKPLNIPSSLNTIINTIRVT